MIEKECNFWLERADYRCIPASAALTPDGEVQLDRPLVKEAASQFNGFALDLGRLIASRGNHVHVVRPGIVSFPIKQFTWAPPSLQIISRSINELKEVVGEALTILPRPGCCPGELNWEDVSKILATLPDNFIVAPIDG